MHEGDVRGAHALSGRPIARGADDGRSRVAAVDPKLSLASALSDEPDNDGVGGASVNDALDQRGLSGAGRSEDSDARTTSNRKQRVHGANARPERSGDRRSLAWSGRLQLERDGVSAQRHPAVERQPPRVDRTPERAGAQ